MKRRWRFCLFLAILFAGHVLAQETETAAGAATSVETVDEGTSKNDSSKPDTVVDSKAEQESGDDATVKSGNEKDAVIEGLKTAILKVTVMQTDGDNSPIKDARVIVTYDSAKEFEHKTDEAGVALLTGLPYGKVDVDVTASGRQSGGGTLVLDAPEKTLTFHLKPRAQTE